MTGSSLALGKPEPDVSAESTLTEWALAACALEPIRHAGAIQPHGVLLAMDEATFTVEIASTNAAALFGRDVLGLALEQLLDGDAADLVRDFAFGDLATLNPLRLQVRGVDVDVVAHRLDGRLVTEWESVAGARQAGAWHRRLPTVLQHLSSAASLAELADGLVADVRALTGYDRVMLYRFDPRGEDGEVIAEDRREGIEAFLGLRYPASDIPAQARALYLENWLRIIPDARYEPVPLVSVGGLADGRLLDLSQSILRSVSPVHLEYLENMGVRSSMSVSIVDHGRLWGLIACHHYSGPHRPSYDDRVTAAFLGRTVSSLLPSLYGAERQGRVLAVATQQARIVSALGHRPRTPAVVLTDHDSSVLDLVPASGAAVLIERQLTLLGTTPAADKVLPLVASLLATGTTSTDALFSLVDGAEDESSAAGVLAVPLGADGDFIAWFRGEVLRDVTWAGDPATSKIVTGEHGDRLSPRRSFAAWAETVRHTAPPWETHEVAAAQQLGHHLSELALRRADQDNRLIAALQRTLLLEELPELAGVTMAARYLPAAHDVVGGDWYDIVPMPSGNIMLVIGDVAGHGLAVAAITAQLRHGLRTYLLRDAGPAAALKALNTLITALLPHELATALVAELDPWTGSVSVASAGHPPALLRTPDSATYVDAGGGAALGLFASSVYTQTDFTMGRNDRLILFTDGLIDTRETNRDQGFKNLTAAALAASRDLDPMLDGILAAIRPSDADDVTMLAVAFTMETD